MKYKLHTKKPQLLCLILLISFPSAAAVLLSPALPAIGTYFHVSDGYTQQLITIFIIGYALGQLIYSPFANRFGRKITISLGIGIYLLSCLICLAGIYSHIIEIVFIGRLFMALGSSVGMVISFTIINDFYYSEQARPITSYTVLAYAFVPALAIALGGAITTYLSWIGCFYFYLIYGILVWIICSILPETLQNKDLHALKISSLIRGYFKAFSSWKLIVFSIIYGLMGAFIYVIASGAPFIGINKIGLSPALYGYLLLIPYIGQLIGALLAGHINKRLSVYQVMNIGYSFTVLGSIFMFICFAFDWINLFSFLMPMFLIMMGLPKLYSNSVVMALNGFQDKATGSAIMSFITMSIILIVNFFYSILPDQNPLMMPLSFLLILVFSLAVFWHVRSRYSDKQLPKD